MSRSLIPALIVLCPISIFAAGHDLSTTTTASQSQPVVTGRGDGFTAVWLEQSAPRIVGTRISQGGEPLDGLGIALAQKSTFSLAIAHSPSESLVAWSTNGSVYAVRLSPLGIPLDTAPLLLASQGGAQVSVAWDGTHYFVVWSSFYQLIGAFVGPDGSLTDSRPVLDRSSPNTTLTTPDLSWDGKQFILAFGEPFICSTLCPSLPYQFSVVRVSETGKAIDSMPVRIPGRHLSAHVASSGSESLIALDAPEDSSTMIVHSDGGVLQLGPEVSLFHWFFGLSSDVTWDGTAYTVGWRYPTALNGAGSNGAGWLAASRISRSGLPMGSYVTSVEGTDNTAPPSGPSVAANEAGQVALVTSARSSSPQAKARLYLLSELTPMPAAPPAPRNVVSYFGGVNPLFHSSNALIEWQSAGGADGFVIDRSLDGGMTWGHIDVVGPDVRAANEPASIGDLMRVIAFGAGGMLEGTVTSIGSQQRRHASH